MFYFNKLDHYFQTYQIDLISLYCQWNITAEPIIFSCPFFKL